MSYKRFIFWTIPFLFTLAIYTYYSKTPSEPTLKLNQKLLDSCQIDALGVIELAGKQIGGCPVELHIEKASDHEPLFAIAILKENPLSIIEVRVNAKTGAIADIVPFGRRKSSTFQELSSSFL